MYVGFERAEREQRLQHPGEGEHHAADGEQIDQRLRNAPAEEAVDRNPSSGKMGMSQSCIESDS